MSMKYAHVVLNALSRRIQSDSSANLRRMTIYDLVGLLDDEPILQREFQRRVHYYEELARSAEYLRVIKQIHNILRAAHASIDPKKLPSGVADIFHGPRLKRTPNGNVIQHRRTTYKKLHQYFSKQRPWYRIGDRPSRDSYPLPADSIMHPWRFVVKQYQEALSLLHLAKDHGAFRRKSDSLVQRFEEQVQKLTASLEVPWERDRIGSFEYVQEFIWLSFPPPEKQDEYRLRSSFRDAIHRHMPITVKQDMEKLHTSLDDVCEVMLWHAAKLEDLPMHDQAPTRTFVKGVEIDMETQNVSFMGNTESYTLGKMPWMILRHCAEGGVEGAKWRVDKSLLHKNEDAVSSEISRINRKWKQKVGYVLLYEKNGFVYLDPRPVEQK